MKKYLIILLLILPFTLKSQNVLRITQNGNIVKFQGKSASFDYNDYADTVFSRFALDPDITRKLLISSTFDKLQSYGLIDTLDNLYFYNAHDVQASLVDWLGDTVSVPVGYPNFVIDSFWYGGTAKYINTKFIPSTEGIKFTGSSASMHVYKVKKGNDNAVIIGARNTSTNARAQINADQAAGNDVYILNNNTLSVGTPSGDSGLYSMNLTGNKLYGYLNGNLDGTLGSAPATLLPDLNIYVLAYNVDGSANSASTSEISMVAMGGSLSKAGHTKLKEVYDYYTSNLTSISGIYVDLIAIDGQSNALGTAGSGTYSIAYPSTEIYDSASNMIKWIDGSIGMQAQPTTGGAGFINPVLATARMYDSVQNKIFFTSRAISGSQLYQSGSIFDWNASSTNEYLDLYMNEIDSTIKRLSERGILVRNIYRVCYQGETDADAQVSADAWQTNQTALITKFNTRFSAYTINHILVEITPNRTYSSTVNAAIDAIAAARSDTQYIDNSNKTYGDGTHLDEASHIILGREIYNLINP